MTIQEDIIQYFKDGEYDKIRDICKKVKNAESYRTMARTYVHENDLANAEEYYKKALKKNMKYVEALNELGVVYLDQKKAEQAEKCFKEILAMRPDSLAYNNMAICLINQGKIKEAEPYFLKSAELNPEDITPLENLCKAYISVNNIEAAEGVVEKAIKILPNHPGLYEIYVGIAYFYEERENFVKAKMLNEKALEINPNGHMAYNNLGSIALKNNNMDESEQFYLKALEIKPDYTLAICNMGNIVKYKGDADKACEYYKQAIEMGDDTETPYSNIGVILTEKGEIEEGMRYYEEALKRKPNHKDILFNYSLSLLLMGDFANGFKYYEIRKNKTDYIKVPGVEWKGEKNKMVLVLPEQGFGDVLQFARYIPMVKERSKKVIFVCPKPLISLMKNLEGVDEIIEMKDNILLPTYENYVYMMSLPYIFKTTVDTIPSDYQYLYADEEKVKYWAKRMKKHKGLKVGLVWTGNPRRFSIQLTTVDSRRSMKLSQFEPLLDIENVTFFSLQKDDDLNQIVDYPNIIDYMPEVNDFSDTAAIIENLDLVISVDTSVVHLAAALNKKVWMLSRYDNCWRWLRDRIDTPWYPSMWILKQPKAGDWESVVDTVTFHLNWLANY